VGEWSGGDCGGSSVGMEVAVAVVEVAVAMVV